MGRYDFSNLPSRSSNLGTVATLPVEAEPQEMPRGQMIALLDVRGGGSNSLFAKVLHCLRAVGSDEPTTRDLTQLREAGYIRWNGQARLDVLTPQGLAKSERIAREIAKLYAVHHITFRFKLPRSNMGHSASCACGGWSQTVGRKDGDDNRLRRYAAAHLEAVERGTWKRQRPIEEFLNEYMPLTLPLSVSGPSPSNPNSTGAMGPEAGTAGDAYHAPAVLGGS